VLSGTAGAVVLAVLSGASWAPHWLAACQTALLVCALLLIYGSWWQYRQLLRSWSASIQPVAGLRGSVDSAHGPQALGTLVDGQRDKVVSRMATGMVHEFNNSLQVVVACAAHLQASTRLDSDGRALCREIIDTCSDTSQLARQLLALGERVVVEKHAVDAVQELALLHRNVRRIVPANISVQAEPPDDQHWIQVDPVHLRHTLLRVCMVLGDAMPDGGVLQLGVGLFERRDVELSVEGRCAHTDQQLESSDTGYAALEAFAKQYHGQATVGLATGGAVRYTLTLPRLSEGGVSQHPNPSISLANRRFLVVDDDYRARQAIKKTLTDASGDVVLASSVQEALDCLEHEDVDVVCADAIMPGQPTRLLLERLRQNFPETKILVCSAYSEGELSRRGIELRRFAHLNKPFAPEQLVSLVQELLTTSPRVH
jgi:CheY-like chemotaxis protein